MGTTSLGIEYPDSSDSVDIGAFQTLADDVNALLIGPTTAYLRNAYSSSSTWTKPANLKGIWVRVVAGGGAGGGAGAAASGQGSKGGGGGAGGYAESWIDAASLASSVTVTIGAGGTGVSNATGNNGNTSSFGSHVVCAGGSGGGTQGSGTGGIANSGAGGTVSAGQTQIPGQPGAHGIHSGNTIFVAAGNGGSSPLGAGGKAGGSTSGSATQGAGAAGTGFGSGGSGGYSQQTGSTAVAGGAGAGGYVLVISFF